MPPHKHKFKLWRVFWNTYLFYCSTCPSDSFEEGIAYPITKTDFWGNNG